MAHTKMARRTVLEQHISNLDSLDRATKSALNTLANVLERVILIAFFTYGVLQFIASRLIK